MFVRIESLSTAVASIGARGCPPPPQTKIGFLFSFVLLIYFPGINILDYWPLQLSIFGAVMPVKNF